MFEKPDDVLTSSVGDELLLLNADSEDYYSLNEVGAMMFEQLTAGARKDDVIVAVAEQFDAPAEVIRADLDVMVGELLSRGLLVESAS